MTLAFAEISPKLIKHQTESLTVLDSDLSGESVIQF